MKLESDGIEDPPVDSDFLLLFPNFLPVSDFLSVSDFLPVSESLLSESLVSELFFDFKNSFWISIVSNSESEIILFNISVNKVGLPLFILIFLHFLHNLHFSKLSWLSLQSSQPSLQILFLFLIALFLLIILSIGLPGIIGGGVWGVWGFRDLHFQPPPSDDVSEKYFNPFL